MSLRNAGPSFDRRTDRSRLGGRVLPYQSGELPEDFADRLVRLKEASGLTWSAFSQAVGADSKQVRRWRKEGVKPSGGAYHSLVRFARGIHGGLEILVGESHQMTFWDEQTES